MNDRRGPMRQQPRLAPLTAGNWAGKRAGAFFHRHRFGVLHRRHVLRPALTSCESSAAPHRPRKSANRDRPALFCRAGDPRLSPREFRGLRFPSSPKAWPIHVCDSFLRRSGSCGSLCICARPPGCPVSTGSNRAAAFWPVLPTGQTNRLIRQNKFVNLSPLT
jgi:hypothetical protein